MINENLVKAVIKKAENEIRDFNYVPTNTAKQLLVIAKDYLEIEKDDTQEEKMIQRISIKEDHNESLLIEFITMTPPASADSALLRFTEYEMSKRLKIKRDAGVSGWNTPQVENEDLIRRLKKNLDEGDYLDVINLAAMIHARKSMFEEKK